MMSISVVTISFNQDSFLEECIQSVLSQGDGIEYIVIDGGSTDGSRQILEKYSDRLAYWVSEPDDGPTDALIKGFSRATGDICCYLNSDDRLADGALKRVRALFVDNPAIDVIYGDSRVIDGEGNVTGHLVSTRKFSAYRYLVQSTMVCQPSTFFLRSIYQKAGGFSRTNNTCWDGELLLEMAKVGAEFIYVPEVYSCFRIHGASITGSGRMDGKYAVYRDHLFTREMKRSVGGLDKLAAFAFKSQDYLRRIARRRRLSSQCSSEKPCQ